MATVERRYAGADWLRQGDKAIEISPLGETVADLLGDLLYGLYHLDGAREVDWSNPHWIEIRWYPGDLATFDGATLTRLVFLAHDRCIRVSISPRSMRYLTLQFHPRKREGSGWERHPTVEQALARHREYYPLEG